jgi:hypothetical protein
MTEMRAVSKEVKFELNLEELEQIVEPFRWKLQTELQGLVVQETWESKRRSWFGWKILVSKALKMAMKTPFVFPEEELPPLRPLDTTL